MDNKDDFNESKPARNTKPKIVFNGERRVHNMSDESRETSLSYIYICEYSKC